MQLIRNATALNPVVSYFQTEHDDEIGLCGKEPSTKIIINKGSEIYPKGNILLQSTRHNPFLRMYFTQLSAVKICHVRNLTSYEFWLMNKLK